MGFLGGRLGFAFNPAGVPWLPVLLILFLLAIVLGLDKRLGAIPGLGRVIMGIRMKTLKFPPLLRAGIIGLATPLLPCGPLYAMLALALAGGSTVRGIETMLAFGLGALPAIWAVQIGSSWVNRKLGDRGFLHAKRGLAAAAALSLMWHFPQLLGQGVDPDNAACRCHQEAE